MQHIKWLALALPVLMLFFAGSGAVNAQGPTPTAPIAAQAIPNMGQQITPLAPHGARFIPLDPELTYDPTFPGGQGWLADHAVTTVVSPDHKTLLVLTSGYNRVFTSNVQPPAGTAPFYIPDSTEYVFVFDISTPTPLKKQVLKIANTYNGIVFDPGGTAFYVSGGPSDTVEIFTQNTDGTWAAQPNATLTLGHSAGLGLAVPP